ncbi:MAG: SDR family NAD(P)-dependent oxidoreductase, partial [Ilumatobacteraceae bacterium]
MALLDAFLLTDRTAVVTGAASGIGRATATLFGDAGAHVVLTDISGDALAATTAELRAAGASCEHHLLDVTDRGGFDALVTRIDTERDGLDILVNNAGIITDTSALNVGADELDRVHAVNFRGVVNGSQAAAHA